MAKKALITGVTGQDGSYLTEFLLSRGYEVHGLVQRGIDVRQSFIAYLCDDASVIDKRLFFYDGDLAEYDDLLKLVKKVGPDELYNLGGLSQVRMSFDEPVLTGNITGLAVTRLLEALRQAKPDCRFFQASSADLFGRALPPQSETSPFNPLSPYAVSKLYAYWTTVNYREAFNIFACNGILFNHESPHRGEDFVTRKITHSVARIVAGRQKTLVLGNLEARKDWGFAPEYVECFWKMLQQERADDFVIGSGVSHTLQEFLDAAFGYVGLNWKKYVETDPKFFRPTEVSYQEADNYKARTLLGWTPRVEFTELVKIMMDFDLQLEGQRVPGEGLKILEDKGFGWMLAR